MIGEMVRVGVIIDYTEVARPLCVEDIYDDIQEARRSVWHPGEPTPSEIVLWEQQWDWIIKNNRPASHTENPNTLFGVPVRLR